MRRFPLPSCASSSRRIPRRSRWRTLRCTEAILAEAEFIGSTADIIGFAEASAASEFIIVTVDGVLYELERRCVGQGKRFYVTKTPPTCADMDGITLDKLVACLESGSGAVGISR
ncbi:MAG: quinolinate synthase NadA [Collinsella sp.]